MIPDNEVKYNEFNHPPQPPFESQVKGKGDKSVAMFLSYCIIFRSLLLIRHLLYMFLLILKEDIYVLGITNPVIKLK